MEAILALSWPCHLRKWKQTLIQKVKTAYTQSYFEDPDKPSGKKPTLNENLDNYSI